MAIRKMTDDLGVIGKLPDDPNVSGGLTPAQLKEKFDTAAKLVQTFLNESLIPDLTALNLPFEESAAIPASTVQAAVEAVQKQIAEVVLGQIPDGSITPEKLSGVARNYYRYFMVEDWTHSGAAYRIAVPKGVHKLDGSSPMCVVEKRMLTGRNVAAYDSEGLAGGKTRFLAAVAAAKAANDTTPGTYPTAADGHIVLTWYQVQYYLLSEILEGATDAENHAKAKGVDWKDLPVDPAAVGGATLDALLTAAYTAALGGPTAPFEALWTVETARGLNLKQKLKGEGANVEFDRAGALKANTWGVMETEVALDAASGELRISTAEPYEGDLMVMG